ncbi:hypothetical protein KI743_07375 [Vibrio sp. D420a]|jgi:hypothetical protein|uniref:hypothetical protein n=1 Tax=Vibrio sp. D420a TaxID=2836895 RepID=UPI002556D54A|nr:hypothetical protein [Vibrio sp. D420a]MDK9761819.1 hypothetical protein [Vibrio sp. D420a]
MKKLLIAIAVASSFPMLAIAEDNADCEVGGDVLNPISLTQSQAASFGKFPVSSKDRHITLSTDGKVYEGLWFLKSVPAIGSVPGQFKYKGTKGQRSQIDMGAFASCTGGIATSEVAAIYRAPVEGEEWWKWPWEYNGEKEEFSFPVGVTMRIEGGKTGHINCSYTLTAKYI